MGAPPTEEQKQHKKKILSDVKRAFLAASTLGTSEIKTGGGQYGDETVADSLFPKTINDLALDDRTAARKAADEANQPKPVGPGADLADQLLSGSAANTQLRLKTKQGRRSTFLTGGQ